MPPTPAAVAGAGGGRVSSSAQQSRVPHHSDGCKEVSGKKRNKRKNKKRKKRQEGDGNNNDDASITETTEHQHSAQKRQSHDKPPSAKAAAAAATTTPTTKTTTKKRKRVKEKPARFSHPQLHAELRRLRRSWLSPGDPLFQPALERSYSGMRHVPADSLPQAIHKEFRRSFDGLHEAGLFLYDTVQAGGKRLSRTFVTRTLLGEPGITYKYLGLRLFAHPWDREGSDFRKGPGDGLADALGDPCLLDLFQEDGSDGGGGGGRDKSTDKVADTLRKVGDLSEWMRLRAAALLKEENKKGMEAGGRRVGTGGSCAFNLTLINRMECSAAKRDLKPDPLFAMGKCSVSWHADSCLQDFSTIGVYHCTDPIPAEPDWGIALRVSQEAEGSSGSGGGGGGDDDVDVDADGNGKARRKEGGGRAKSKSGQSAGEAAVGSALVRETQQEKEEVSTPPLLVPLQSGDAYFLLDDFNHFHEHAVVSGSCTLRYSSTHRVAAVEGNTFSHVQKRCEEVLAGGGAAAEPGRILDLVQVRAEQALLTELEFEWLNQFWVQGRRHAILHPWWRGPMALVLATWRELERRTALTVQRLMSLRDGGLGAVVAAAAATGGGGGSVVEPAAITRAFETVLRTLEERRESRSRWAARFADPAYRSLSPDCSPVVPALWPTIGGECSSGGGGDGGGEGSLLPEALVQVISRLRECYTAVYREASGGKKAGSAKAIAAGAASNWEIFRTVASGSSSSAASAAASSSGHGGGKLIWTSNKHNNKQQQQQQQRHQQQKHKQNQGGGPRGGTDAEKRHAPAGSRVIGGRAGGGGGQGSKRKGSKKRRQG